MDSPIFPVVANLAVWSFHKNIQGQREEYDQICRQFTYFYAFWQVDSLFENIIMTLIWTSLLKKKGNNCINLLDISTIRARNNLAFRHHTNYKTHQIHDVL